MSYCFIIETTANQHISNSCETKHKNIRERMKHLRPKSVTKFFIESSKGVPRARSG